MSMYMHVAPKKKKKHSRQSGGKCLLLTHAIMSHEKSLGTDYVHVFIILNAQRMHMRVTLGCLFECQHMSCVQQIELTNQVSAKLQRFSTDGFCYIAFFPEFYLVLHFSTAKRSAICSSKLELLVCPLCILLVHVLYASLDCLTTFTYKSDDLYLRVVGIGKGRLMQNNF